MRTSRRRNPRRRRGAAAVELALIMPLFVTLILGTIEATRIGMVVQMMNVAAREGCRTASWEGMTSEDVYQRIDQVLTGSGIPLNSKQLLPTENLASVPGGEPITVHLTVNYDDISWLGNPFGLSGLIFNASATMSSERPDF